MSTNSYIAVRLEDGTFQGVYCHYDGYLSGVGMMLKNNYRSRDRAIALTNLGSISALHQILGTKNDFYNPIKGVTLAYHRDRDDDLVIDKFDCIGDLNDVCSEYEYAYLFIDGKWMTYTCDQDWVDY